METTTTQSKQNKVTYSTLLVCMFATLFIAIIYFFLVNLNNFDFVKNGEPAFTLNKTIILWLTACLITALGSASFMQISISADSNKTGLKLNLILFYSMLLFVLLWALFCYSLSLPTIGLIMLSIATAISIFLTYRFTTRSIVSGTIIALFTLWLMYLIYLNFAYVILP